VHDEVGGGRGVVLSDSAPHQRGNHEERSRGSDHLSERFLVGVGKLLKRAARV
jgi:hypothetical protein